MCKNGRPLFHRALFQHNYLPVPPIHIHDNNKKSLRAELLGQNPSSCVQEPRSVRACGPSVEAGFGDCAGIRGEWPPVRRTAFVSTLREGFAGSHYRPPPLAIRCSVLTTGHVHHQSSESQKYTNTPWNDRRMWRKNRRRCRAFGSLRSASSALFSHLTPIFS